MKKVSEHLGQIIVALAAIALLVTAVVVFRVPLGGFFQNIVSKETSIADAVLANMDGFGVTDMNGSSSVGGENHDADDQKANAYALLLDDTSDVFGPHMIFVREDESPAVGENYNSEAYGELEVLAVYTGFETGTYDSISAVPWYDNRELISEVVFEDTIAPASTARWFHTFSSCVKFDMSKLDTSNVTSMKLMFTMCDSLSTLDVSSFDVDAVTDMQGMFSRCYLLQNLDLSSWNTSAVSITKNMFNACESLTTISVSELWSITNITDSEDMFIDCFALAGAISYDENKVDATYANYIDGYFTYNAA